MSDFPFTPEDYSSCYGCGSENPVGLHMAFERMEGGGIASRVTFGPEHVSSGRVHPGFVALALDEVAVQALLYEGVPNVSVELAITQRAALAPGEEVVVSARRESGKGSVMRVRAYATRVSDGLLVADAAVACMRARVASPGRINAYRSTAAGAGQATG